MTLNNKVAVITGADGAIGSKLTTRLQKEGVKCILIDKNSDHSCDFTDSNSVIELAKRISLENTTIDFLFNVAGIGIYKEIDTLTIDEWDNSFSINVTAPFILSKYLESVLVKSDKPMIFNVGSGMGIVPTKNRSAYCASKFALRGLSLSLSKELADKNIDVCLFTLGSVMSPFGTGGIDKRKQLESQGKKYLSVDQVVEEIIKITKSESRKEEYTMYPDGYI